MKTIELWSTVGAKVATKRGARGEQPNNSVVERLVRSLAETIVEATSRGETVYVPGLGKFRGRSDKPKTVQLAGEQHVIPSKVVLVFRAASGVRILRRGP